jgi:predicted Kef-type K+ transport protein
MIAIFKGNIILKVRSIWAFVMVHVHHLQTRTYLVINISFLCQPLGSFLEFFNLYILCVPHSLITSF